MTAEQLARLVARNDEDDEDDEDEEEDVDDLATTVVFRKPTRPDPKA